MNSSFMILVGWQYNRGDHWECPNQYQIFDLWVTECLVHFTQISEIETLRHRHRCPACVAILDQKSSAVTLEQYDLLEVVYKSPFPNDGFITQIYLMKLMTSYLLARPPQSPTSFKLAASSSRVANISNLVWGARQWVRDRKCKA